MTGAIVLIVYVTIFVLSLLIVGWLTRRFFEKADFTSLKTVTFGDESAVRANRVASVLSVLAIFALWVAFTNSSLKLPPVSYTHLRAHETPEHLVCRLLLEKKK